jgi:dUTP pyrophosphatase
MKMKNIYVSYYLYSRSSTPLKTPLRLANSVGIIDSGYRGHIKAVFDNKNDYDFMEYNIEFGSRLTQLCPPNLEYPMKINIVNNIESLGITNRGTGGFGSTGI